MSATPYVSVFWNDSEITSTDKLNQMGNNEQWLFENTPRVYYNAAGVSRTSGVKVLAGTAIIAPTNTSYANAQVSFGTFFSTGCMPIVSLGIMSYPTFRLTVAFSGIGQVLPNNNGIFIRLTSTDPTLANQKIANTVYVNYIVIGW